MQLQHKLLYIVPVKKLELLMSTGLGKKLDYTGKHPPQQNLTLGIKIPVLMRVLFSLHRSSSDGLLSTFAIVFAIVFGALAATVLLLMCASGLLCVKRCFSYFSSKNTGKRFEL